MLLDSRVMAAVTRCIAGFTGAIHEYSTVHVKLTLAMTWALYVQLGYKMLREVKGVTIFAQKGAERIRIIHAGVNPHDAWAVTTQAEYKKLCAKFDSDPEFKIARSKTEENGDEYTSFLHMPTNYRIRVIFRKQPLFEGTFGK